PARRRGETADGGRRPRSRLRRDGRPRALRRRRARRTRDPVRDRRVDAAPPAERPRRHRADAAARGCDLRLRGGARMNVAVLPGDGIGPEVAAEAIRVLDALGIAHTEHAFGGNAILAQGTPLPDETLAACREADAVLLAAVGLPELEGKPVR